MLTPLVNCVKVPAYDPAGGKRIIETTRFGSVTERSVVNTFYPKLFSDEPIVEIGYPSDFDNDYIAPVVVKGEEYYPWWCYGSAIKRGNVFAVKRDLMADIARNAQDSYRFGRWALPNGTFGAGWGKMRVINVPAGTIYPGLGPIEDGFAFIDKMMVKALGNYGSIKLGESRGSYQFWQRLNYSAELWNELYPEQLKRLEDMGNASVLLDASGDRDRVELCMIDPSMTFHPMVALHLRTAASEAIARIASTFPQNGMMKVAVPTIAPTVAWGEDNVLARFPIDDFSIKANKAYRNMEELTRITELEVIEYSVSNIHYHDKGHAA